MIKFFNTADFIYKLSGRDQITKGQEIGINFYHVIKIIEYDYAGKKGTQIFFSDGSNEIIKESIDEICYILDKDEGG